MAGNRNRLGALGDDRSVRVGMLEGGAVSYRFDVTHRSNGTMAVSCDDCTAASERTLARMMVELGVPDAPVEGGRHGKRDWTAPSLHRLAAGTITEGERGFAHGIYAPYPPRDMHPELQHAIEQATAARQARVKRGAA